MEADFHRRLRQGYLELAAAEPERVVVLDGTKSPDEVVADGIKEIRRRFGAGRGAEPAAEESSGSSAKGRTTRFSDSSLYDEGCTRCGATDGWGDKRLNQPCPAASSPSKSEQKVDVMAKHTRAQREMRE